MILKKHTIKKSRSVAILFIALIISQLSNAYFVDWSSATQAQDNKQDIYDVIPDPYRRTLIARLNLLIKSRASNRWESLFDLLSESSIKGRSKSQFIADYEKFPGVAGTGFRLVSFQPKRVERANTDHEWLINGCAHLRGVRVEVDAFIVAFRERDDWYFSDIDMLVPRDTNFRPCQYR